MLFHNHTLYIATVLTIGGKFTKYMYLFSIQTQLAIFAIFKTYCILK